MTKNKVQKEVRADDLTGIFSGKVESLASLEKREADGDDFAQSAHDALLEIANLTDDFTGRLTDKAWELLKEAAHKAYIADSMGWGK